MFQNNTFNTHLVQYNLNLLSMSKKAQFKYISFSPGKTDDEVYELITSSSNEYQGPEMETYLVTYVTSVPLEIRERVLHCLAVLFRSYQVFCFSRYRPVIWRVFSEFILSSHAHFGTPEAGRAPSAPIGSRAPAHSP